MLSSCVRNECRGAWHGWNRKRLRVSKQLTADGWPRYLRPAMFSGSQRLRYAVVLGPVRCD
jgi:hypothetical protein